jgi:hypothetical protein
MMETTTQKHTKTHVSALMPAQAAAVDLLCTGRTITATATALDLRRETVSEWINHNALSQDALNSRRNELWFAASDRLRTLADRAIDVLAECLEGEGELRFKSAVALLKCSGLYGSLTEPGYPLKAGQLTYDCRYSTMHGMPVTGGLGFRGLKPLWYNSVPP